MLRVFVGPDLQQWILSNGVSLNDYGNHWLVRKSAAAALSQGFFQFAFGKGSDVSVSFPFLQRVCPRAERCSRHFRLPRSSIVLLRSELEVRHGLAF